MNDSRFVFGIGLQSNKESNDFLRCLWSRIAASFGKLAWQYNPIKVNNTIFVGHGCISEDILLNVRLGFKKRGCLAFINFSPSGSFDANKLHSKLKQCVNEALNYKDYEREVTGTGLIDKNLSFIKKEGHNFRVEGNRLTLRVRGYDDADCSCMFKAQIQQICNLLTFDTLKYITLSGTLTEEIRNNHNFITCLVNEDDGESDSMERNEMYRNLEVSDKMAQYLDSYLERSFDYENHFSKEGLGMRQVCDWCRLLWTFRDKLDLRLLEVRLRKAGLMSEWKAFGAYAVEYLGMSAEAMPFYSDGGRWKRKAKLINKFILSVGNMGHKRGSWLKEHDSWLSRQFVVRKTFSMFRRIGDLMNHARIFPLDSLRFSFTIMKNGVKSAMRGEG